MPASDCQLQGSLLRAGFRVDEYTSAVGCARGLAMKRFVDGQDRSQSTLFPERLDDYICEDNPFRAVEAFVEVATPPADLRTPSVPSKRGCDQLIFLRRRRGTEHRQHSFVIR